ncbi:arrestin [Plectosphaerella plurivora]|uniref:Arrestin n=1 Tax=Plectosphaerella plurivora TaxID=936078 RepID=A0A9P8VHG0_9PEZI|nr:arrestin [Plectosphaerella plurivora]
MSIRIVLDNQPEFYTNLDFIEGRVILSLNRAEQVGGIIVKLEGESKTALTIPSGFDDYGTSQPARLPGTLPPGNVISESHKILYKVQQVFPTYEEDVANASSGGNFVLQGGQHEYPFRFRLPLNNACSDPVAMSKMGGLGGLGGYGAGGGLFGIGGLRVMDGSKQLFLPHVTKTLPPSFTGLPRAAEIRYYVKVTIQRPGLLKENWRYQVGFKFMPIEPPRPQKTAQEAFARRPFAFRPRPGGASAAPPLEKKRSSLFMTTKDKENAAAAAAAAAKPPAVPPSIEVSARLPHPSILTCNEPLPLRIIAKKLAPSHEQVYVTSLQIDLIGTMQLRAQDLNFQHPNRWVVVQANNIEIPVLGDPASEDLSLEHALPDDLWRHVPLPNTVAPSFVTCNMQRTYELELKLGLTWGRPSASKSGLNLLSSRKDLPPQTIYLPLHFSKVQVYSSITPPPELVQSILEQQNRPGASNVNRPPRLPPRTNTGQGVGPSAAPQQQHPQSRPPVSDPLYPPQLGTPGAPAYDEAPPSYDEAMAEQTTGPFDGMRPRPAFSGETNENAPSQMPEKS